MIDPELLLPLALLGGMGVVLVGMWRLVVAQREYIRSLRVLIQAIDAWVKEIEDGPRQ